MVSKIAEGLIGSEIIKIAGEVNDRIKSGENVYNLTIGDFNPKLFPIPMKLKSKIIEFLTNDETNYPPADGILKLRKSVSEFIERKHKLSYNENEILIGGGARPMIYSIYRTLLDEGDKVIFPVPSWNNNHYSYLTSSQQIPVDTKSENNFMITSEDIRKNLTEDVVLISLCSPQNPTGTTFNKESLSEICQLVISENKKRQGKPLYVMFDQIYSELCFGEHFNPVTIFPEMREYIIFVDGISKSLSATGLRVGWAFGPKLIISKMKSILGHIGAWSPKAEQLATAEFISDYNSYESFLEEQKSKIKIRLNKLYEGFLDMKESGFKVDVIKPEGAIYLTVKFDLIGSYYNNKLIETSEDITMFLIDKAKVAMVPFSAFGTSKKSPWFRISIGTLDVNDISNIMNNIKNSLTLLNHPILN
jgi:aspartate aminotransferase